VVSSDYRGSFVDGLMDGYGQLTLKNGTTYTGEWKKGLKHGQGHLVAVGDAGPIVDPNHNTGYLLEYEGMWYYDTMHGKGLLKYESGFWYEGDFSHGQKQGHGKETMLRDAERVVVFEGLFEGGDRVGPDWNAIDGLRQHIVTP